MPCARKNVVENSFFFRWGVLIGDREAYLGVAWRSRAVLGGHPFGINPIRYKSK